MIPISPHARQSSLALALVAVANLLISCSPSTTAEPEKAKAAEIDHLKIDGLHMNGSAIRTKFGLKVYKVDLYLSSKSDDEEVIFNDRDPKRIEITMLREVTGKKFESSVRKNIETNFTAEEKKNWNGELETLLGGFADNVLAKDSTVLIDYIPTIGTRIAVDGEIKDSIPGADFYHALLRLWIGNPPQESVKHGLLDTKL